MIILSLEQAEGEDRQGHVFEQLKLSQVKLSKLKQRSEKTLSDYLLTGTTEMERT